jgi:acetyl-CoA carboxylase/biotin carboxylase 1
VNKVLGREVYTSNLQLGGENVMGKNGWVKLVICRALLTFRSVSHLIAENDIDGALQIVSWLSYIPAKRGAALPILNLSDSWDREVSYKPPKETPYDPRLLVTGSIEEVDGETKYLAGLFDKDSWMETLPGWAQSVVIGPFPQLTVEHFPDISQVAPGLEEFPLVSWW